MAEAKVIIKAQNNISSGLKSTESSFSLFATNISSIASKITAAGAITAIIAAGKKLIDFSKESVNEFNEADRVSSRLSATMKNLSSNTKITTTQLLKLADSYEKSTFFTSEAIQASGQLLLATKEISDEVFPRALQASMDLAEALGEDVTSAASTMAKALQDPENGLKSLRSAGVTFTDSQEALIKSLVETGDKSEAQAIVLERVEAAYKGVAESVGSINGGKLDKLKDVWGDFKENFGEKVMDGISPVLDAITSKLEQWNNAVANGKTIDESKETGVPKTTEEYDNLIEAYNLAANNYREALAAVKEEYRDTTGQSFRNDDGSYDEYGYGQWLSINKIPDLFTDYKQLGANLRNYQENLLKQQKLDATNNAKNEPLIEKRMLGATPIIKVDTEAIFQQKSQSAFDTITTSLGEVLKGTDIQKLRDSVASTESSIASNNSVIQSSKNSLKWNPYLTDDQKNMLKSNINDLEVTNSSLNTTLVELQYKIMELTDSNLLLTDEQKEYWKSFGNAIAKRDEVSKNPPQLPVPSNNKVEIDYDKIWSDFGKSFSNFTSKNFLGAFGSIKESFSTSISSLTQAGSIESLMGSLDSSFGELLGSVEPLIQLFGSANPILVILIQIIQGFVDVVAPAITKTIQPIFDTLQQIGSSIGSMLLPILDELYPMITMISNMINTIIGPILQIVAPFLQIISTVLAAISPILVLVGKALTIVLSPIQWLGDLFSWLGECLTILGTNIGVFTYNLTHWVNPKDYVEYSSFSSDAFTGLQKRLDVWDDLNMQQGVISSSSGTSTDTAVTNASYTGGTSITVNIYQEAPIVGDGGMDTFASMIRERLATLDYYSI